jgi:hypothetical protein
LEGDMSKETSREEFNLECICKFDTIPVDTFFSSPKSIYRLSNKLGIDSLEKLALHQLAQTNYDGTHVKEAVTKYCTIMEPVRKIHVQKIKAHWVGLNLSTLACEG